jgi:hypothetical protein
MRWSERVRRIARTRLGQLAGAIVAAWLILFVLPRLYHLLLPVNSEFLFQEARRIAESVQPAGNRAMARAHIARALVHAGQVNQRAASLTIRGRTIWCMPHRRLPRRGDYERRNDCAAKQEG